MVQEQSKTYGILILPIGLLFGWAVMGWAVYANPLFFLILDRVKKNKSAGVPIFLVLLLVGTLPFFSGTADDISRHPVEAWGWGALVWITALFLAASASGIQQRWLTLRQAGFGLGGLWCLAIALHTYQWTIASAQEREIYLSGGMAITVVPLCGVPLTWPKGAYIGPNQIPEVDVDPALNAVKHPSVPFLTLERYQSDGFTWITYGGPYALNSVTVKVRHPAQPRDFTLLAKATPQGAMIRLVQQATGKALYEQSLRTILPADRFSSREYCPQARGAKTKGYQDSRTTCPRTNWQAIGSSITITA